MSLELSRQWWSQIKTNPEKLRRWLQRQYIGELAAVNLLSEVLMRFGPEMAPKQWDTIKTILVQEMKHASWIHGILLERDIPVPKALDARDRYWSKVYEGVETIADAMAAAENAEHMRLWRIQTIAEDPEGPADLVRIFKAILPDEQFHERSFSAYATPEARIRMTPFHEAGMELLF